MKTIDEWIKNETQDDRGLLWGASLKNGNSLPMIQVTIGKTSLSIPQTKATYHLLTFSGKASDVRSSIIADVCSNYEFNGSKEEEEAFTEQKILEDGPYKVLGNLMKDTYIYKEAWHWDYALTNEAEEWETD